MEAETRRKIEEMVLNVVKNSNIEKATEFSIRVAASERLGMDLSESPARQLVRSVIESYLISVAANEMSKDAENKNAQNDDVVAANQHFRDTVVANLKRDEYGERVICQLSNGRNVAVNDFKGKTMVSIRDFYMRDGKLLPSRKGISLSSEQWSTFKKSVPAIEEAITKMEERIRLKPKDKQKGNVSNSVVDGKQNEDTLNSVVDDKQNRDVANATAVDSKQNGDATNSVNSVVDVAPLEPVVPIEVIRFDGKNFQLWAQQMELLFKRLKIEYVLIEPCPNTTLGEGAKAEGTAAAKAAERRWLNDDLMCWRNILSHLSDPLFNLYSNRKMSGKELWEELKLLYLYEEFGTKRSQVKKYIEFQIVDDKEIIEQIRELNDIADSITAAGMFIDDNFHVSVIISKLPPSWKHFCVKLMCEEYLSFRRLMERIQIEEEYRYGVKRAGEHSNSIGYHQGNRVGQRRADYKPLGMYRNRSEINTRSVSCSICGKRGHLSQHCWRRYDKQTDERKTEENVRIPRQVDTPAAS
ncbi:hypothetical protein VNO78_18613 [Psophocarpus tetragonolobus]|uniref:CCHC-type domain-containing protein n=1 Tax=Psophocarpus tetragonolobus TaxID=3891 RepID=A0AAN9SJ54_PSOTE